MLNTLGPIIDCLKKKITVLNIFLSVCVDLLQDEGTLDGVFFNVNHHVQRKFCRLSDLSLFFKYCHQLIRNILLLFLKILSSC